MNLLLIAPEEVSKGTAVIIGRRAEHVRAVLKKKTGETLKAGIINQGTCEARVVELADDELRLELGPVVAIPPPQLHLALAIPRPKALSRVLSAAASFGVERIVLFNAWRVEKSYFTSPRLDAARMRQDAWLGCEQGRQVWLPEITVERSFRRYVEDVEPTLVSTETPRVVLHPASTETLATCLQANHQTTSIALAVGPEGGFIDHELESLAHAGYRSASLGTGPLKTEVALAAALGQLALVRLSDKFPITP